MAARVNINSFKQIIVRQAPSFQGFMHYAAQARLVSAHHNLLKDIINHPISKDIVAGPEANGSSLTGGIPNLFSFIGFPEGSDPISLLLDIFSKNNVRLLPPNKGRIIKKQDSITFEFPVIMPSLSEIRRATPLPFSPDKSWTEAVETGLWGLSHYLYGLALNPPRYFATSRSGPGIEASNPVRSKEFSPAPYLTEILNNFRKRLAGA